ncbi:unnamed protein product [Lactuca virosa]|uniref:Germin-like protein n=1 Tax=Lactuca virosa TaxID=75947 RepID=A0AAU9N563_9ASTR|nr:unnamed protein product [Lactuca virosa]
MASQILLLGVIMITCTIAFASDSSPLQDFCVADFNGPVLVNGFTCKDPKLVQANDFFFSGLHLMGNTSNAMGAEGTLVTVAQLPGTVQVGFITSSPENRLITKVLEKGDVFVFPQGLVHFQRNVGNGNAIGIAGLSSENPGVNTVGNAVFGAKPDNPDDLLANAFQVDVSIMDQFQWKF